MRSSTHRYPQTRRAVDKMHCPLLHNSVAPYQRGISAHCCKALRQCSEGDPHPLLPNDVPVYTSTPSAHRSHPFGSTTKKMHHLLLPGAKAMIERGPLPTAKLKRGSVRKEIQCQRLPFSDVPC